MERQQRFTVLGLLVALIALAGLGGWIANIVKLVGSEAVLSTGIGIARVVGIFVAPLGAVLGYV